MTPSPKYAAEVAGRILAETVRELLLRYDIGDTRSVSPGYTGFLLDLNTVYEAACRAADIQPVYFSLSDMVEIVEAAKKSQCK